MCGDESESVGRSGRQRNAPKKLTYDVIGKPNVNKVEVSRQATLDPTVPEFIPYESVCYNNQKIVETVSDSQKCAGRTENKTRSRDTHAVRGNTQKEHFLQKQGRNNSNPSLHKYSVVPPYQIRSAMLLPSHRVSQNNEPLISMRPPNPNTNLLKKVHSRRHSSLVRRQEVDSHDGHSSLMGQEADTKARRSSTVDDGIHNEVQDASLAWLKLHQLNPVWMTHRGDLDTDKKPVSNGQ